METPTIDARSRRQNSRRALVIVPPGNLWYSCIHSLCTDYLHSETSNDSIHSTYTMPETFVPNFFILRKLVYPYHSLFYKMFQQYKSILWNPSTEKNRSSNFTELFRESRIQAIREQSVAQFSKLLVNHAERFKHNSKKFCNFSSESRRKRVR